VFSQYQPTPKALDAPVGPNRFLFADTGVFTKREALPAMNFTGKLF